MLPTFSVWRPFRAIVLALTLCVLTLPACIQAQEHDDLRRMLDQRSQHRSIERERTLLEQESKSEHSFITVDGERYTVEHNASDVGRALYLSLQHWQWAAVQRFLDEYLTLSDCDPLLVHYARGALARTRRDYAEAERQYRELLVLQPGFLPGRLELARALFDDQQDVEAGQLFDAIAASLDADDPKTAGIRRSVATFQRALAERRRWNGSVAWGAAWSDNLNRSSASTMCWAYIGGQCWITQTTPDPIASTGLDYDANLNKQLALRGHHGVYPCSLLFDQSCRDNRTYNELIAITQAGYRYRSGRHSLSLAPSFEYYAWGNRALYGAWGAHAEWSWMPSPASLLKLEGDWKAMRYRRTDYTANYDGVVRAVYARYFRSLGRQWTAFGGADVVDSASAQTVYSYLQRGVRLGASLRWPRGVSSTVFASYRHRRYGAYSALLGTRRTDEEQGYTFVLKVVRWAFAGFTPLLTPRHTHVRSDIDWLYSYDGSVVSLKLERLL